jgi:hypothetical protein
MLTCLPKVVSGIEINFFDDALEIGKTFKKNVSSVFLMQDSITVGEGNRIAKQLANGKAGLVHVNVLKTQVAKNGKTSRKFISVFRILETGETY